MQKKKKKQEIRYDTNAKTEVVRQKQCSHNPVYVGQTIREIKQSVVVNDISNHSVVTGK